MTWGADEKFIRCKEATKKRFDALKWSLQAQEGKQITQDEIIMRLLEAYEVLNHAENTHKM